MKPKRKADQEKLAFGFQSFAEDDPTFTILTNPETRWTMIAAMGELMFPSVAFLDPVLSIWRSPIWPSTYSAFLQRACRIWPFCCADDKWRFMTYDQPMR
jgi:hypothetical protein